MQKNLGFKIEFAVLGLVISSLIMLFALLGAFNPFINFSNLTLGSLQTSLRGFDQEQQKIFTSLGDIGSLIERSDNYQKENLLLKARIVELENNKAELEKVTKQANSLKQFQFTYARVTFFSEDGKYLIINRGKADGVNISAIVTWDIYLVGTVIEAGDNYAKVELLRASTKIIPVKIVIDNQNALLQYVPGKGFLLKDLPRSYKFKAGSDVVTLGIDSAFPFGLSVGQTEKLLSTENDISQTIQIDYPIEVSKLEEVYVLKQ